MERIAGIQANRHRAFSAVRNQTKKALAELQGLLNQELKMRTRVWGMATVFKPLPGGISLRAHNSLGSQVGPLGCRYAI